MSRTRWNIFIIVLLIAGLDLGESPGGRGA